MAKTECYVVQGWYSSEYGWEDVSEEDTLPAAKRCRRDYDENEPGTSHRVVIRFLDYGRIADKVVSM